jgi:hypothetical protein
MVATELVTTDDSACKTRSVDGDGVVVWARAIEVVNTVKRSRIGFITQYKKTY